MPSSPASAKSRLIQIACSALPCWAKLSISLLQQPASPIFSLGTTNCNIWPKLSPTTMLITPSGLADTSQTWLAGMPSCLGHYLLRLSQACCQSDP